MKKPRRIASLTAIAALAPLALAGCSSGGGAGDGGDADSLSIVDYYNNDPDKSLVQAALDRCAADLGVSINRETVPGKDLIQKVLQRCILEDAPGRADAG